MLALVFLSLLLTPCAQPQTAPALKAKVDAIVRTAPGTVSLFAKNLDTGATFALRADDRVRTASTIKLPIMVAIFAEVAAGRAKWTDEITLTAEDKVSGSGVLGNEFSPGVRLPIRDLMHLMIVVSDNTATNLLLDRFTADTVNAHMEKMGFAHTRSMRKILGDRNSLKPNPSGHSSAGRMESNQRFGIGSSTPREMVRLLEMIEMGKAVSPEAGKEMIAILKRQQYQDGIARYLGSDVKVASKSGALDALRSDVGIVYAPKGRIAMAITVDGMPKPDWTPDNAGHITIAKLAQALVEGLIAP
jgi:beta-lactamase class A